MSKQALTLHKRLFQCP